MCTELMETSSPRGTGTDSASTILPACDQCTLCSHQHIPLPHAAQGKSCQLLYVHAKG